MRLDQFFFVKRKFKIFFRNKLKKEGCGKNTLDKQKRMSIYYQQGNIKKIFIFGKIKFFWNLIFKSISFTFRKWNFNFNEKTNFQEAPFFFPKLELFFKGCNHNFFRGANDFSENFLFFSSRVVENLCLSSLSSIKKIFIKINWEKKISFRNIVFKVLEKFFIEIHKITRFNFYFCKTNPLRNISFLKNFGYFQGKISNFWFFFWKNQMKTLLFKSETNLLGTTMEKKLPKNLAIILKFSRVLKNNSFEPSLGLNFFSKVFYFDFLVGKFFFYFLSLPVLRGKNLNDTKTILENCNIFSQNFLEWKFRNEEHNVAYILLNGKISGVRKISGNLSEIIREKGFVLSNNTQNLKRERKIYEKNIKGKVGTFIEGKKKVSFEKIHFLDQKGFPVQTSLVGFKFNSLIFSQFSSNLFKFLKKIRRIFEEIEKKNPQKQFLALCFFTKIFF